MRLETQLVVFVGSPPVERLGFVSHRLDREGLAG